MNKKVMQKARAYAELTNTLFDILELDLLDDGTVVYSDEYGNLIPLTYNKRTLKRITLANSSKVTIGKYDLNLDLVSGNSKILESIFENYLSNKGHEYISFGMSEIKGERTLFKSTPSKFAWVLIMSDDRELQSEYYEYKCMGLCELLFTLEGIDMRPELRIVEG